MRVGRFYWQYAVFFLLSAGFGVNAAMGVVGISEAQVGARFFSAFGFDVFQLSISCGQFLLAVNAQAALVCV